MLRNTARMAAAGTRSLSTAAASSGPTMRVMGLQSGNACDGIDAGIFEFSEPPSRDGRQVTAPIPYKVLANKTFAFDQERRDYILSLRAMRRENGNDYAEGNYQIGEWCAEAGIALAKEAGIPLESIDLIGSHGQSISGHPHWEFGDLSVIAQRTGITTAGDFRPADVAAGGNGTPCTCTFDNIMLRPAPGATKWRTAINIGGTSSVSFLPPQGSTDVPIGLDPGLGVFFMDLATERHNGKQFDEDGKVGRSGKVNEELLAHCLQHKYFTQTKLPIGVGTDDFPETLFHSWAKKADSMGVSGPDLVCTMTELTARSIAMACKRFCPEPGVTDDVILRGGIRNNSFFMERMALNLVQQQGLRSDFSSSDLKALESIKETPWLEEDSWENSMYAMMGYLCFRGLYNFVPSCTGASRPVVGGRIAPGNNYAALYKKYEIF